jgi:hypothetical protein
MRFSVYLSRHDVQAMWGGVVSAKKGSTKAVSWADPDFSQSIHPDVGCSVYLSAHDGQCGVLRSVPNKRYQSISQSDSKKLMLSQKSTSVAPCTKVHTMSNMENRAEQQKKKAKGLHTTIFALPITNNNIQQNLRRWKARVIARTERARASDAQRFAHLRSSGAACW